MLTFFKAEEIFKKLMTYKKFMFARDPIERLLSAFRNKFESGQKTSIPFQKDWGQKIQKLFRKDSQQISSDGSGTTFQEFVGFLVNSGKYVNAKFNEHWTPMVELCQPCLVR